MIDLPELSHAASVIRISPELDVPVTPRIKRIIDTASFQRLSRISQLGLVSLVYPGATHTRMEHSLGVYRNAIEFLKQLARAERDLKISEHDAKIFLLAALLHDIGHWPYCHAIEDLRLDGLPRHELLAQNLICGDELGAVIQRDWNVTPSDVADFLARKPGDASDEQNAQALLVSMLSGPIDIDKLDYLERDSLHAGVPYGCNFDRHRLIQSLCVDRATQRIAITDKGRTAAEMMVFARYVMFSEVYWHHTVRSATAMLQRAVFELRLTGYETTDWLKMNEVEMRDSLLAASEDQPWAKCVDGLFGGKRILFKRVAQFDCLTEPELHRAIARRPYPELVSLSRKLVGVLSDHLQKDVPESDVLIDAPPVKLEVQFDLKVRQRDGSMRTLGDVSPVVQSLATRQFDDLVKRVRVFVSPEWRDPVGLIDVAECLREVL